MKLLYAGRCLLLFAASAVIITIGWDLHGILRSAHQSVDHFDTTINDIDESVLQLKDAAVREQAYYDQGARQMAGSLKALRLFLDRTDRSLNDAAGVIPRLNASIDQITADAGALTRHTDAAIDQIVRHSSASFDGVTTAVGSLNSLVSDPHALDLFANLDSTSGHLNVIAANSESMSSDMRLAVHRLAQPPSKFHQFLDVSYTALKFGSLFVP